MDHVMQESLASLTPGAGKIYRNMAIFPITFGGKEHLRYVTLAEAFNMGTLTIREVNESGNVPELWAVNKGDSAVLILDGEELQGAKQNRILNASVLLKEHSETIIPVSCTEQGRWHSISRDFRESGNLASSRIRAKKMSSVSSNLEMHMNYRSDQGEVWDEIDQMEEVFCKESSTHAMSDSFKNEKKELEDYYKEFPLTTGQKGLAVFINGAFIGLEMVSREEAYQQYHEKIIQSYAMHALMSLQDDKTQTAQEPDFAKVIKEIMGCQHKAYPSIGYGEDYRYRKERMVGSALIYQETPIHAAFFRIERENRKRGFPRGVWVD
jgi:hypothetical protein